MKSFYTLSFCCFVFCWINATRLPAQEAAVSPVEDDYYKIITLPVPEDILIEAGGVCTLPNGSLAVSTRRGDVYIIDNPYMENGSNPRYRLFASGLHEILGLAYVDGDLVCAQRGELTRLKDTNGDGYADEYVAIYV
jgi:glucose/arabinose dehydrogenase